MTDDEDESLSALGGAELVVDGTRWRHVLDRHPELEGMMDAVKEAARSPEDVFVDAQRSLHVVKRSEAVLQISSS